MFGVWLDSLFLVASMLGFTCQIVRGSVANVSYMLHDSVGDYTLIVDIILLVRSVRWQTSCHGET